MDFDTIAGLTIVAIVLMIVGGKVAEDEAKKPNPPAGSSGGDALAGLGCILDCGGLYRLLCGGTGDGHRGHLRV
jgi:hypothetical protein